jgi:predicted glycoside hydrolase/deacetylase ChbG (UPF0249 family)
MIPIILSADDYALNAGIDLAVIDLVRRGLLTATSCLVLSPRWKEAAKMLDADIRARADIGLHLDFTEFAQSARHTLPALIALTAGRMLQQKVLTQSIHAQLDRFEAVMGAAPDYIDGHQHVHQLPQIRDALVAILKQRYGDNAPWIRLAKPAGHHLKESIISMLGARQMSAELDKARLRHSDWLLGVYGFDLDEQAYRTRLALWLGQAAIRRSEVCTFMCHPAISAKSLGDPICEARVVEYKVLTAALGTLLNQHGLKPARGDALARHARTVDA